MANTNTTNKKKGMGAIIFLVIIIILAGVFFWKKDFFLNLLRKKQSEDSNVVVNTITKYITTKSDQFPLKEGSSGTLVEQLQNFYNNAPSQVVPNRTSKLLVDGKWGKKMTEAFKKSGFPTVITKEVFNAGFQLK